MKYVNIIMSFAALFLMSAWDSGSAGAWAMWTSYAIIILLGSPIIIAELKKESASCRKQENGHRITHMYKCSTEFGKSQDNLSYSRRKVS